MSNIVHIKKHRRYRGARVVGINLPKKWQGTDDVFLHRSQIKIGLHVTNYGRLFHGTRWEVVEIKTTSKGGRVSKVNTIRTTNDIVVLLRVGSNESTQMSFNNLSYSAIWRIAE